MRSFITLALAVLLLQGCSTRAHFSAVQDGTEITIAKTAISGVMPLEGKVPRTTFGRYPVRVSKEGYAPLYLNLPLKVDAGVIVLDAIFFAPAAFFNVQGSAAFYRFDLEGGTVSYKRDKDDDWVDYRATEDQKRAAKSYFGGD